MFRLINFLTLFLGLSIGLNSQKTIQWMSWEEALEKHKEEERKIFVDIYTDWCTWCKKMEKSTLSNQKIVDYINANYYAVKFNAETKEDIIFDNKIYKRIKSFGRKATHELAIEIMNGDIGYPTVAFIDEDLDVLQPIQGFIDTQTFEMIMIYFGDNHYQDIRWKKYVADFRSKYSQTIRPKDIQPKVQTARN